MANPTSNFPLMPARMKNGAPFHGQVNTYCMLSTYATAAYIGDPVLKVAAGANTAVINTANNSHPVGSLPVVELAALTDTGYITGVIVGFEPVVDSLHALHGAASTTRVVKVVDDPDVLFHIRDDGNATPLGVTAVGLNAVLIAGTANTDNSLSGVRLDAGTGTAVAADITYQLRIKGVAQIPNNDPTLTNTVWEVVINKHTEAQGVGVAGI